jgi:hypothetical protein
MANSVSQFLLQEWPDHGVVVLEGGLRRYTTELEGTPDGLRVEVERPAASANARLPGSPPTRRAEIDEYPVVLMHWGAGAAAAMRAVRLRRGADGIILGANILLALACDTEPGSSAIGRALRERQVWNALTDLLAGRAGGPAYTVGVGVYDLELRAEEVARSEQSRLVGERHLVEALGQQLLSTCGVDVDRLGMAVRQDELGPDLHADDLAGRWHGMVDANILIQYEPLDAIDWRQETGSRQVTLWVPGSLLNELDLLAFQGGTRRVRERSAKFAKWLDPRLDACLAPGGLEVRDGVNVRLWMPDLGPGTRDTDHLESAIALRALGVPLRIVTADIGFRARARVWEFDVLEPSQRWRLSPEQTPGERELAERLRRAQIQLPPILSVAVTASGGAWTLSLLSDAEGGEAREIEVAWQLRGAAEGFTPRDMRTNDALTAGADGTYRQTVPGSLPPGEEVAVAGFTFFPPPRNLHWGIRASGGFRARGTLSWWEGSFVSTPLGTGPGAT